MGPMLEELLARGRYFKNDSEFGDSKNKDNIWSITKSKKEEEKVYTYDEAINLTGNGRYNICLLIILAFAIQSMALDMFGFSVVVNGSACDLQIDHAETSTLLSMPLFGSILMSYPWGYFSDTQGRKKSLMICLCGSFIISSLSAFSPNWIILAVLRFLSSTMSSGIQSMAYTLLGESCSLRTKGPYMIILTSSLMTAFATYAGHGYVVLSFDFEYDLGFITFKPWRLLALSMASTLGISAILVSFFYESPKFLVNIGRTEEALDILQKIRKRNCGKGPSIYPVRKIILTEATSLRNKDVSMLRSLWLQTAPIFQPPLLWNTPILFYITAVIYSANNGFFLWVPLIIGSFFEESNTRNSTSESFCDLIRQQSTITEIPTCTSVNLETFLTSIVQGVVFIIINFVMSLFAHRRKTLLVLLFVFCSGCCFLMLAVSDKITSIVIFFGLLMNCLGMGIMFSYYVDLFPTAYRGMVSCLGVLVARGSALAGVNLVGSYIFSDCSVSLYLWGAYTLSGALVALLLPADAPNK